MATTPRLFLTRHRTAAGPEHARWALNGRYLPADLTLSLLLELPARAVADLLAALPEGPRADDGDRLAPVEPLHEVWAAGVTYLRSRDARRAESTVADIYEKVYDAERPEVFLTATGWRVVGDGMPVRIRRDSTWDVPEPELVVVLNQAMEVVGYCAGNDMSSRSIEGENPLYLPQAKVYDGSCALGPGILLAGADELRDLTITLAIRRGDATAFQGETSTAQMKRGVAELAECLGRETSFPQGAFLMTGTGLVPPEDFTLQPGDVVRVTVGDLTLVNPVAR
ncbi:MAG TPA: fumarylacetoacetate hydrolase family protein [Thermomicrobiaceae bacterium]|nr:fumarylacetoacetate hydrolase family protein [Thermomicrobiaceae bacterium]